MEITDVETIPVEVPVKERDEPYGIAPYVGGGRFDDVPETVSFDEALSRVPSATTSGKKLLVRLDTDGGVTGWGEMKVPTMAFGRTAIDELIAPAVIGREVWEIEAFVDEFSGFGSLYYADLTGLLGGVEMAMWDAYGKALDQPVHRLLGGKCIDSVPVAYCLGLLTPDESREYARFAREEGFSVVKTKASRYWQADVERVTAMHDAVDGEIEFRVDPNQRWNIEDAVRFGAQLEDAGIYLQYMEQPIRVDSIGTLVRLRERLQTPIAINEDAYIQHNLGHLLSEDAIDAAVVDLVPAGGILALKNLAAVAGEAGISLSHHSNFDLGIKMAAKLHLAASTPALNLPLDSVYYSYEDCLLTDPLDYNEGEIAVPDRPGLAGEIDETKLERYRLD